MDSRAEPRESGQCPKGAQAHKWTRRPKEVAARLGSGGPTGRSRLGAAATSQAAAPAPAYLLQLGVPWQLLHDQGEALGELQLARPGPLPQQHLPVSGHTQHAEAVAVAGLGEPDHLGQDNRVWGRG